MRTSQARRGTLRPARRLLLADPRTPGKQQRRDRRGIARQLGATVTVHARFTPDTALAAIERDRPTLTVMVPAEPAVS